MEKIFSEACGKIVPLFQQRDQIISTPLGITMVHSMAVSAADESVGADTCVLPDGDNSRAILVTDDENAAMKMALLLSGDSSGESGEDGEWEYDDLYWDLDDEELADDAGSRCAILDARAYGEDEKTLLSPFLLAEQYWNENTGVRAVLFLGIESVADRKKYLGAVAGCAKEQVFLHIPEKMVTDVDVQRLVYQHGFRFLYPEKKDDAYYEALVDRLLLQSSYELFEGFDTAVFLKKCRQKWQGECSEDRIAKLFDHAAENARKDGRDVIEMADFEPLLYMDKKDAYDALMGKIGLDPLKEICRRFVALELEKRRNPKARTARRHMLFYGKPGTGKTTGAAMLAKVMAEKGIGNGKFVIASRKELIGSYVGHTAPRVAAKFEEAKGGILFVDEAGFFNQEESGGYVREAFKEFIRYMEICDDVTVIFAMYPKEQQQFLKLDDGMASRIAHIVRFEDYDHGQLAGITEEMLGERGYRMPAGGGKLLEEYFKRLRTELGERFGNARECRKLVDEIVLEISLRNSGKKRKDPDGLTLAELKAVLEKMTEAGGAAKANYGFQATRSITARAVI